VEAGGLFDGVAFCVVGYALSPIDVIPDRVLWWVARIISCRFRSGTR
jgi:hypothetical protein